MQFINAARFLISTIGYRYYNYYSLYEHKTMNSNQKN